MKYAMRKILKICLLTFVFSFAENYTPFNKPAYLTSSFGENRGTRYHAGIDYTTNMEEGWPIVAPEKGSVAEVRMSPYGYGKVLFFKGKKSKQTWVFAHLSGFSFRLDSLIQKEQFRLHKNDIRIYPKVIFNKGDTLAFSGSSGIGNPHLHLEIRKDKNKIISPCSFGVSCGDSIAPQILAVAVWNEKELKISSGNSLQKGCIEKPLSEPPYYMAFKIVDYSKEPFENPMSIKRLSLMQNGNLIYQKWQDSLSFKNMLKIRTELLWAEEGETAGDWHFTFNPIQSSNGKFKISVEDYANHPTEQIFNWHDSCEWNETFPRTHFQDSLVYTFLSRPFVSLASCNNNLIQLQNTSGKIIEENLCNVFTEKEVLISNILKHFPMATKMILDKDSVYIQKLKVGNNKFSIPFGKYQFSGKIENVQAAAWPLSLTHRIVQTDSLDYLEIQPKGLHFTGNFEICVDLPPDTARQALYYLGETTRQWFYFSNQKQKEKKRCATMNELRDIAIIKDSIPPQLGTPYWATAAVRGSLLPVLRIPVIEKGSGIQNGNAVQVFVKDSWLPVEFDSEPKELVLEKTLLPPVGEKIRIQIRDEIGNQANYFIAIP